MMFSGEFRKDLFSCCRIYFGTIKGLPNGVLGCEHWQLLNPFACIVCVRNPCINAYLGIA